MLNKISYQLHQGQISVSKVKQLCGGKANIEIPEEIREYLMRWRLETLLL